MTMDVKALSHSNRPPIARHAVRSQSASAGDLHSSHFRAPGIAVLLTVCAALPLAAASQTDSEERSDTVTTASRNVRIEYCPQSIPLTVWNAQRGVGGGTTNLEQLLWNPNVAGAAGAKLFEISIADFWRSFEARGAARPNFKVDIIDFHTDAQRGVAIADFNVYLQLPSRFPFEFKADEFLDASIERLEAYLSWLVEETRDELLASQAEVEERQRNLQALEQERAGLRNETPAPIHLSLDVIQERITECDRMVSDAALELAGLQARRRAIEQQIAGVHRGSKVDREDDPIGKELKGIVELREKEVARLRNLVEYQKVSLSDLAKAEGQYAEARIELLRHQHPPMEQALADQLADLNTQLASTVIDIEELAARKDMLEDSPFCRAPEKLTADAERYRVLGEQIKEAGKQFEKLKASLEDKAILVEQLRPVEITPIKIE